MAPLSSTVYLSTGGSEGDNSRDRTFSRPCYRRQHEVLEEDSLGGPLQKPSQTVPLMEDTPYVETTSSHKTPSLTPSTQTPPPRRRLMGKKTRVAPDDPGAKAPPQLHRQASSRVLSRKHSSLYESASESLPTRRIHDTWYYSSNHVLVNRERMVRGIPPMTRSIALDEKAKAIAKRAAEADTCNVFPGNRYGHVLVGSSIRNIHDNIMSFPCEQRKTILSREYDQFGIATHKGPGDRLYLCQIFDQTRIEI